MREGTDFGVVPVPVPVPVAVGEAIVDMDDLVGVAAAVPAVTPIEVACMGVVVAVLLNTLVALDGLGKVNCVWSCCGGGGR